MSVELMEFEGLAERVDTSVNGNTITFTWSSTTHNATFEMAKFNSDSQILSIFPKVGADAGLGDQFSQIREIQIDTSVSAWDVTSPVNENDRGELELVGLPHGFGKIFSYGLGLPRAYRGLIHAIQDQSSCTVVRFGAPDAEGPQGSVFHISFERFTRFVRDVDVHEYDSLIGAH